VPGVPIQERLKKYCSHSEKNVGKAVFLIFGFVSAQLQGFSNLLLRRSLAKNQKSSLRIGYSISLTALATSMFYVSWGDLITKHLREKTYGNLLGGSD
jgi:hypothetical protein